VADHIASGSFDTAMNILNKEYGIVNYTPMKDHFMNIYRSNSAQFFGSNSLGSIPLYLFRNWREKGTQYPKLLFTFGDQIQKIKDAYSAVTEGRFQEAQNFMENIFIILPLLIDNQEDREEKREMISICREYCLGIQLELARKELTQSRGSDKTIMEYSVYFTHCDLQLAHKRLAIGQAMRLCAKQKIMELLII